MANNDIFQDRLKEFFGNIWNHSEDEFQASFDERRKLNADELAVLENLTKLFQHEKTDSEIAKYLQTVLIKDAKLIEVLLQVSGLTRNKILQDVKASSGKLRKSLRLSSHLSLASHQPTWLVAGLYLVKKLKRVLNQPAALKPEYKIFEALNQATWPLLSNCGIPFEPEEKADNPLCRDIIWNGVSFDIVIPNGTNPLICVKSTVHTANIGQYGESKDHLEIDEARRMIDSISEASRPTLVGFIDGVGFESNRAGLEGVLRKSDEFCQFKTIWKLVVIAAFRLKLTCYLMLPESAKVHHKTFLERYIPAIRLVGSFGDVQAIEAGEAMLTVS
jgi:hypothetical protein